MSHGSSKFQIQGDVNFLSKFSSCFIVMSNKFRWI